MYKIILLAYWTRTLPLLSLPPVTCTASIRVWHQIKISNLVIVATFYCYKAAKKKQKPSTSHGTVFRLPPDIITPLSPLPGMPVPEGHGSLSVLHAVEDFPWLTFRCLSLHRMAPIGMRSLRLHARVTSWGGRFDWSSALAMRRVFAVMSVVLFDPGGRQTWGLKARCFRKRSFDWTWHFPTRSARQSLTPYLWLSSLRKPRGSGSTEALNLRIVVFLLLNASSDKHVGSGLFNTVIYLKLECIFCAWLHQATYFAVLRLNKYCINSFGISACN